MVMGSIMQRFDRWGIGLKLAVIVFILVGVIFTALFAAIGYATSNLLEQRAIGRLETEGRAVTDLIEIFDSDFKREAARLAKVLRDYYPNSFVLDKEAIIDVG